MKFACRAAFCPAMKPVDQQIWRLKPPDGLSKSVCRLRGKIFDFVIALFEVDFRKCHTTRGHYCFCTPRPVGVKISAFSFGQMRGAVRGILLTRVVLMPENKQVLSKEWRHKPNKRIRPFFILYLARCSRSFPSSIVSSSRGKRSRERHLPACRPIFLET